MIGTSIAVSMAMIYYISKDQAGKISPKGGVLFSIILFLLGLFVILSGEIEMMKLDKVRGVVRLKRKNCFGGGQRVNMKTTQIKGIKILMNGGIKGYNNNDIHYVIEFETITGKRYEYFHTGDRRKIKERFYEIRTVMSLDVDLKEAKIHKNLRGMKDKIEKKNRFFEEDRLLLSSNRARIKL